MSDYDTCPTCEHMPAYCYCLDPNVSFAELPVMTAELNQPLSKEESRFPVLVRLFERLFGRRRNGVC